MSSRFTGGVVRCRAVGAIQDITERRKTEAALRQAQKMEAVGSLAGGIAHDFNDLLSFILSHAELLMRETTPGGPMHADLAEIGKAGKTTRPCTEKVREVRWRASGSSGIVVDGAESAETVRRLARR